MQWRSKSQGACRGEECPAPSTTAIFAPAMWSRSSNDFIWLRSAVPLTIRRSTDYDFRLTGRIQDAAGMTGRDTTLMPRLPVAPPDWVLPPPQKNAALAQGPNCGKSDIYVYL